MAITIKDFSKQGLVNAIVQYIRSGEFFDFASEYADAIEDGSWLEFYNNKIAEESPDWNN